MPSWLGLVVLLVVVICSIEAISQFGPAALKGQVGGKKLSRRVRVLYALVAAVGVVVYIWLNPTFHMH
jgi:hypothetical protein